MTATTHANNARPAVPHDRHTHTLTQPHFFDAADVLRATYKLPDLGGLAGKQLVKGDKVFGVRAVYQGSAFC